MMDILAYAVLIVGVSSYFLIFYAIILIVLNRLSKNKPKEPTTQKPKLTLIRNESSISAHKETK